MQANKLPTLQPLGKGEIVKDGDYLQIGDSYLSVNGTVWIGHVMEQFGPFERVWRRA